MTTTKPNIVHIFTSGAALFTPGHAHGLGKDIVF